MTARAGWALCALLGSAACGHDEAVVEPISPFSVEELMKPETCRECHPMHYDEWSGSMHAYAATDPVFIAMNARGQAETAGKLGDFCVNCHAPMAVRTGATTDGQNLAELPSELGGVTCYFCHNVASVDGTHNAQLTLAMDQHMRGGIREPVPNRAHRSAYSPLMDGTNIVESSSMCGACHDIVTSAHFAPAEVELERTFKEWQDTVFNVPKRGASCSAAGCHMAPHPDENVADAPNVSPRTRHNHQFPAVDIALTDFPQRDAQREAVQGFLDIALRTEICVAPNPSGVTWIRILIENFSGHRFPSGAAQDRRLWVEVVATRGDLTYSTNVVPDGVPATEIQAKDPKNFWLLRDIAFDREGNETHMFWDVATPLRQETVGLPAKLSPDETIKSFVVKDFEVKTRDGIHFLPERVTLRVRLRPVGLDVIDDLSRSGYDPGVRDAMPTFDLLPGRRWAPWPADLNLEWTRELYANKNHGFNASGTSINGVEGAPCVSQSAPRNGRQR